jgi:S1-C subfamily serine protease
MKHRLLFLIFIPLLALISPIHAQDTGDLLKAVVLIRSMVPADARTAGYLGTSRQSNGVVIDSNGLILTIGYAILEAEKVEVIPFEGKVVPASIIGLDMNSGLGVIRAEEPLDIVPMPLGDSSKLKVGSPMLVASYAGAEEVLGARLIAIQEFAGYWEYLLEEAIFTAPPYQDFGGAALVDRDAQLIGIGSLLTRVSIPGSGVVPCNMFVPVDLIKPILGDLLATGRSSAPPRPWLGIQAQEAQGRLSVIRVSSGGPGEKAGVQRGDLILAVNGVEVKGLADYYRKVWALGGAGVDVNLRILRGAKVEEMIINSIDRNELLRMSPTKRMRSEGHT